MSRGEGEGEEKEEADSCSSPCGVLSPHEDFHIGSLSDYSVFSAVQWKKQGLM